jgi:hypothetical protein
LSQHTEVNDDEQHDVRVVAAPLSRLRARGATDNFIIGFLLLFMLVYLSELAILIPCGSFGGIAQCHLPAVAQDFWSTYFKIDPIFLHTPDWYTAILYLQDFLFNPWWIISLLMFWTGRQDRSWYKTITILICGVMVGTSAVAFQVWAAHYPLPNMFAMLLINGPWAGFALFLTFRLRHRDVNGALASPRPVSPAVAVGLMLLPTLVYGVLNSIAIAVAVK